MFDSSCVVLCCPQEVCIEIMRLRLKLEIILHVSPNEFESVFDLLNIQWGIRYLDLKYLDAL